jgi:hypothetical protein
MKRVFRYHLGDRPCDVTVLMPRGAQLLHVCGKSWPGGSAVYVWALIDDAAIQDPRVFLLRETGDSIPHFSQNYVGTAHLGDADDPEYVLHVFEARL